MPHTLNSRVRNIFEAQLLRPAHKPGTYEYRLDALMNYQPVLVYKAWPANMPVSARARPELQPHDIMLRFAPFPVDLKPSFSGLSDLVGKTSEEISLAAFRRLTSEIGERRATLFVYRKPSWLFTWSHFGRLEEVPLDDMPDEQLMSAGEIVCRCFMKKLDNSARHHGVLSANDYKNAWDFFDARDLWAKRMQELKACGSSLVPCFERIES